MSTQSLADSLSRTIDEYTAGDPRGRLESHDLTSLSARIGASSELTLKLLGSGALRAENQTIRGDESRYAFTSDNLNSVKTAILQEVVGQVIDSSESEMELRMAAPAALREHKANLKKNAEAKTKEFSGFPPGIVQLSRFYREEDDNIVKRAASTATKVAGVGALTYGAASLLRGRAPGRGIVDSIRAGHAANKGTVRIATNWIKPRARLAGAVGANMLDTASEAAKKAAAQLRR